MVLSFVKDQICFGDDKKKRFFYVIGKSDLFLYLKKRHIFYEEDLIHKIISCYMTQTKQTTKQQFMISLFQKSAYVLRKIRFVS